MKTIKRVLLGVLLWMALVGSVSADPAKVNVAIISDAASQNLAALVTTELSNSPDVGLLDRDDLAKVGDELKLQQLAGSDAVALGKLIGANGLLFISKGDEGFRIRFTAVGLGYALFDDQVASEADLPQLAKSIAHRVVGYAPKLSLDPAKAIPISVLNLRADYATADSTLLERKLTLLLESRLASLPDYVVLERRHAWSLGFERSLDSTNQPLLHGSYVVDGAMTIPVQDTENMTVHLRLRTPNGQEVNSTEQGLPTDLPGLVEKIVAEIKKTTGSTNPPLVGQVENEAHEYLMEGLWGWQHNADESALEALDSAELLGGDIAAVTAIRIQVLSDLINKGMENWHPRVTDQYKPSIDNTQLSQKTDDAIRAIQDVARYRDEKFESQLQALSSAGPGISDNFSTHYEQETSIYPISKLLVLLDEANSPRADELRKALRIVTGYDPLHGQMAHGFSTRMNAGDCSEVFADHWAQSLDEELAYYRLVCAADQYYYPYPLRYATDVGRTDRAFCARFAPKPEEQQQLFDQFVQSLKDVPGAELNYLILQTMSPDQAVADAAFKAYLDELGKKRDELVESRWRSEWHNAGFVPKAVVDRNSQTLLPLLHYDLTHANSLEFNKHAREFMWRPEDWSSEEASAVWKDYLGYRERAGRDFVARHPLLTPDFSDYETPFLKKFPQFTIPASEPLDVASSVPPLVATKFWHPWLSTNWPYAFFNFAFMGSDDDGVWLAGMNPGEPYSLFRVKFVDFSTQIIPIPGEHQPRTFAITPGAIYMTWEKSSQGFSNVRPHEIARYDPQTSSWAMHDLPDYSDCQLYNLDNVLYMFLSTWSGAPESAITRYEWDQDKMTILSSTRRIPAQNQFDDRPRIVYAQIFSGPGHKPCVTTREGTFYIQDKPGPWPEVFSGSFDNQAVTSMGKTVVLDQRGEVTLLDPDQKAPEYLMAPAEPHFRKAGAPGHPSVKEATPWADQTIWDPPQKGAIWHNQICFHDESLFILYKPKVKGGDYDLVVYQKGKGREPRHIPLEFHLDDKARALLSVKPEHAPATWNFNQIEHPDTTIYPSGNVWFYATQQGLYIQSDNVGFWFLPYTDIDSYLKAQPAAPADSASPATTQMSAPKTGATSAGGNTINPGDSAGLR